MFRDRRVCAILDVPATGEMEEGWNKLRSGASLDVRAEFGRLRVDAIPYLSYAGSLPAVLQVSL